MNLSKHILVVSLLVLFSQCKKEIYGEAISHGPISQPFNSDHSKGAAIQNIMNEFTSKGVPGVAVAIRDKDGIWEGASGYSRIENKVPLSPGFVHAAASITKTYIAAAVLKLMENGFLDLDSSIINYLPVYIVERIDKAEFITVRMLLNHTSGVPDYIEHNTKFKLLRYNQLSKGWTVEKALSYAYNKPLRFNPGSSYSYSNNNYILLSLLIEHVTKQPEGLWLEENIFKPLGLRYTYYKTQPEYLRGLPMPNFYMDRYGDGRLENVTGPAKNEIESELGDGGLVATPQDFVLFLDALMNGQLISTQSLSLMKEFGSASEYGLGLETGYNYNEKLQYGHQGAVYGGFSLMLYFEEQQTSFYISINADASLVGGKTLMLSHELKNKIATYLASF